jgi:hypothetical protein
MRKSIVPVVLVVAVFVCFGCSPDVGTPSTEKPVAGAATLQSGKDGVKAASGGGLMPHPRAPQPGEHIGAPGAGAKSGGG